MSLNTEENSKYDNGPRVSEVNTKQAYAERDVLQRTMTAQSGQLAGTIYPTGLNALRDAVRNIDNTIQRAREARDVLTAEIIRRERE